MKHLHYYTLITTLVLCFIPAKATNTANDALTFFNNGVTSFNAQKYDEAIDFFTSTIAYDPACAPAYFNLGLAYTKKGDTAKALWCFEHAVAKDPNDLQAHLFLGMTYQQQKNYAQAETTYQAILSAQPTHIPALKTLAGMYQEQSKHAQSLKLYEQLVILTPEDAQAHFDLANAYSRTEQFDLAIEHYKTLLNMRPNNPNIMGNIGHALRAQGHMTEAMTYYQKALPYLLNNPYMHYGLAETYLATGNYIDGFREFEWRYQRDANTRKLGENAWDGSDPAGKTILVRCEYGQGDTIQFLRFAKMLKDRGARVIIEAQDTLVPLLQRCSYIDSIVTVQDPAQQLPTHDFQIPLMSLPRVFTTSLKTLPANVPYIRADNILIASWKRQLANDKNYKIGICWKTSPYYESFKIASAKKSVLLSSFIPLAQLAGVSLYSLQKMDGLEELNQLPANVTIHSFDDFDGTHGRFMDTAALIENLDLVISVDTSVAHIAGALGKPVYTMLPLVADWRWLLNRTDTPWYPTMKLFRQETAGSWEAVITAIINQIKQTLNGRTKTTATKSPKSASFTAEVQAGELVDKITILEIKKQRIKDAAKRANVEAELNSLLGTYTSNISSSPTLESFTEELLSTNKKLWDIEDALREKESKQNFDQGFIDLARSVYFTNDYRCKVKRAINELLGSRLLEEKSYTEYSKKSQ